MEINKQMNRFGCKRSKVRHKLQLEKLMPSKTSTKMSDLNDNIYLHIVIYTKKTIRKNCVHVIQLFIYSFVLAHQVDFSIVTFWDDAIFY